MSKLRVLDLFSGIGGFSLGLERTGGFETVAFCEIEEFPRRVLAKHWPGVPCFQDVRKLKGSDVGTVDVICGGYPCQPFSTAGKRRGKEDDRHLWPEFSRLVDELRPTWVIGENVAGHISMGLDDVLSDLEGQGYACRTFVIPACAVDAPHRRDRCWTVAYSGDVLQSGKLVDGRHRGETPRGKGGDQCQGETPQLQRVWVESGAGAENMAHSAKQQRNGGETIRKPCQQSGQERGMGGPHTGQAAVLANADNQRSQGGVQNRVVDPEGREIQKNGCAAKRGRWRNWSGACEWFPEPNVGRVANGVPARVDRLKALGNAVVPQIPEMIGRAILASMEEAA